jgi:hypothetical protein
VQELYSAQQRAGSRTAKPLIFANFIIYRRQATPERVSPLQMNNFIGDAILAAIYSEDIGILSQNNSIFVATSQDTVTNNPRAKTVRTLAENQNQFPTLEVGCYSYS